MGRLCKKMEASIVHEEKLILWILLIIKIVYTVVEDVIN